MRFTRSIVGLAATGLVGTTLALAAPAAQAHHVAPTATTLSGVPTEPVTYGDTFSITGSVDTTDGSTSYVGDGVATLYVMEVGSSAWVPVATDDSPSSLSFYDVKATANASYKVAYAGWTEPSPSNYSHSYAPSESAPVTVQVKAKVKIDRAKKKMTIKGKIGPKSAAKKVLVHIKKGKKWKKFKTVKVRNGKFQVTLPSKRGGGKLYFRITIPSTAKYIGHSEVWYTYTYRQAALRTAVK